MQTALTAAPDTAQQPDQANAPALWWSQCNTEHSRRARPQPQSILFFRTETRHAQPREAVTMPIQHEPQAATTHRDSLSSGPRGPPVLC